MISVIRNTQFWSSASNMLILLLTDLLKALIPPFIFAECILAVNSKRFSFWTRVLLFIPGILPGVAGTIVWARGIFGSGSSGLLNGLLSALNGDFVAKSLRTTQTKQIVIIMLPVIRMKKNWKCGWHNLL